MSKGGRVAFMIASSCNRFMIVCMPFLTSEGKA
jgi:hypothetical protein